MYTLEKKVSLLTILIPTYNRASTLSVTIKALLVQADALNVPIIVVDNSSTDETPKLLEELHCTHPCLDFISRRFNIGGDGNIVCALSQISSDYVWILGDDDLVGPNALSIVLGDINSNAPDWINYSSERRVDKSYDHRLYSCHIQFLKTFTSWDQLLFVSNNIFRLEILGAGLLQGSFFQITQSAHIVAMIVGVDRLSHQKLLRNSVSLFSETSLSTRRTGEGNSYNLIPYLSSSGFMFSLFSGPTRKEVVRLNRSTLYNWLSLPHIFRIFAIELYVKKIHGISWFHLAANSFILYRFQGLLVLMAAILAKFIGSQAYRFSKNAQ